MTLNIFLFLWFQGFCLLLRERDQDPPGAPADPTPRGEPTGPGRGPLARRKDFGGIPVLTWALRKDRIPDRTVVKPASLASAGRTMASSGYHLYS